MEYARIPTGLLLDRTPERDLVAILRYQLPWAHLEQEPSKEIALRHMSPNQLERALKYHKNISDMVSPDIAKLISKRSDE